LVRLYLVVDQKYVLQNHQIKHSVIHYQDWRIISREQLITSLLGLGSTFGAAFGTRTCGQILLFLGSSFLFYIIELERLAAMSLLVADLVVKHTF
jgi:hypothetical protein